MHARAARGTVALAFAVVTTLALDAGADGPAPAKPPPAGAPPAPASAPSPTLAGLAYVVGTVVDDEGNPVEGATVKIVRKDPPGVWTGTSDAKGAFAVKGLPSGPVMAFVSAKGRVTVQKDLKLPATGSETFQATLERGVHFAGRIVDTADKPVAGANVSAFDSTEEERDKERRKQGGWGFFFRSINLTSGGSAVSDADGRFEIDGLSSTGTYRLHVAHAKYIVVDLPGLEASAGGGHDALDVTLEPAAWVTGVVVDPAGKPIANARVRGPAEEDDSGGWFDTGFYRFLRISGVDVGSAEKKDGAVTDAQGRFSVGSLCPGDSRITASAMSYFDGNVVVDGLVAGEEKPGVKIVIEPATAWLEGTIVDDQGKAVEGVQLWADGDQGRASDTKSDAKGHWKLERVRSRSAVTLHGERKGYVDLAQTDVALNSNGLRLTIRRTAHVKLKVVGPDGKTLEQVSLSVTVMEGTSRHTTWHSEQQTPNGVDLEVPSGEVTIKVMHRGLKTASAGPFTADPAKTVDAGTITMAKPEPKKGKDGKPVEPDDGGDEDGGDDEGD